MVTLTIEADFAQVQRHLDTLRQDVAAQATARAVNRTIEQARTAMSREIRAEFAIGASTVNESLRIRRASYRAGIYNIEAELQSTSRRGRSLNLIHFAARQTAKGVTVKVKRQGPRKLLPGAFIGNQGRTVFRRVGKARKPIEALQTINVSQMFNTRRINARVVQFMRDKFPEVFEREARYYTDRFNAQRGAA